MGVTQFTEQTDRTILDRWFTEDKMIDQTGQHEHRHCNQNQSHSRSLIGDGSTLIAAWNVRQSRFGEQGRLLQERVHQTCLLKFGFERAVGLNHC